MNVSFKDTLNLPRTEFPLRSQASKEDAALLARWEEEKLSQESSALNVGAQKYIVHDGPPYANGPLHLGHAYNKILKDILTKSRRMMGYHVPVVPGWDCHGLPIELKVSQEQPGLSRAALKKACRAYAQKWIDEQKSEFKKLGVLMDWDNPYTTMDPLFEAQTVRALGKLVKNGYIERKNKTVAWCASCQTTLASAEIEYKDRKDPSVYALFSLTAESQQKLFPHISDPVSVLIWTTTPWTLPLNRAVLANATASYNLVEIHNKKLIIGSLATEKLCTALQTEYTILTTFSGEQLKNLKVMHPFITDFHVPVILDDSVELNEGTAFVHCAPGCGPIDYEIGVKNGLEIYSPVSPAGLYTSEIRPQELVNLSTTQGQGWVITKLMENGALLHKGSLTHSYPHCWRCHNGLIFRATRQWFFDLGKNNVQEKALQAIESIAFIPPQGKNFLKATIAHRWEWCLSRQRVWGTPIPGLLCSSCDYVYMTPELIEKVALGIEKEGIEFWDTVTLEELISPDKVCPQCKTHTFVKEQDILDVWFDSGVTHYAVLLSRPELSFPADVYLEGIDQHRGWFQSSLLTSMVLEEAPCMKTIMTHGFATDAKGQKMSKSKGNVVSPADIIQKIGTDGLRLWVASIGLENDPTVSPTLLENVAEVHRKIRNTLRFLLSVLYDFDPVSDALDTSLMLPIDKRAVEQIAELNFLVQEEYKKAYFTGITHKIADYCTVELSARYFDIIKDRLYVEEPRGQLRRSAQTACSLILDTLTKLIAPIVSFTAEQVASQYQKEKKSIHLQLFSQLRRDVRAGSDAQWKALYELRSVVLKAIELLREEGIVKQSMEAQLTLSIDFSGRYACLKDFIGLLPNDYSFEMFLKEFCIVSQVTVVQNKEGLASTAHREISLRVAQAEGNKCPRCWQWDKQADPATNVCRRCASLLKM